MVLGLRSDPPTGLIEAESSPYIVLRNTLQNTAMYFQAHILPLSLSVISYTTAIAQNTLKLAFSMVRYAITALFSLTIGVVRHVLHGVGLLVWLVCEPFSLMIRIIEYNALRFVNIWIKLLFNTQLENLMTVEYGLSQLKVIAQWVRFINVMCLAGIFLGISTYYTVIKMIYWATKLETKEKRLKIKEELRLTSDINKRSDLVAEFEHLNSPSPRSTPLVSDHPSLIEEYILSEQGTPGIDSGNIAAVQEASPPTTATGETTRLDTATTDHSMMNELSYERLLHTDQDDDVLFNYESLNSLASESSTIPSSPLVYKGTTSPVTQAFRSRLSSLNSTISEESTPQGTLGSSVFSSTRTSGAGIPVSPITTIEEDENESDEDYYKDAR